MVSSMFCCYAKRWISVNYFDKIPTNFTDKKPIQNGMGIFCFHICHLSTVPAELSNF